MMSSLGQSISAYVEAQRKRRSHVIGGKTLSQLAYSSDRKPRFKEFTDRCQLLPRDQAFDELTKQAAGGETALHWVMYSDVPLALVKNIASIMHRSSQSGQPKRNLFAIADAFGNYPLHVCARMTIDLDVLAFVILQFPPALSRLDCDGHTPLDAALSARHRASRLSARSDVVLSLQKHTALWPTLRNQGAVKCCLVHLKRRGMTAFVAREFTNNLSPPQFVFKVLDELKNREMKSLAEEILSYVGTNVGLPSRKQARR